MAFPFLLVPSIQFSKEMKEKVHMAMVSMFKKQKGPYGNALMVLMFKMLKNKKGPYENIWQW